MYILLITIRERKKTCVLVFLITMSLNDKIASTFFGKFILLPYHKKHWRFDE